MKTTQFMLHKFSFSPCKFFEILSKLRYKILIQESRRNYKVQKRNKVAQFLTTKPRILIFHTIDTKLPVHFRAISNVLFHLTHPVKTSFWPIKAPFSPQICLSYLVPALLRDCLSVLKFLELKHGCN